MALAQIQSIIMPPINYSDSTSLAIAGAGFAGGYFLLAPYFGASDMIASALVGWAAARSVSKLAMAETFQSILGVGALPMVKSAVNAALPFVGMYLVAGMYPMVDLTSSLIVYGSYVAGAYAVQAVL